MMRTILEFLLSRSLDEGTSPAPWLRSRVQRDPALGQFDSESKQLATLLDRTAAEHRKAMTADEPTVKQPTPSVTLSPDRQQNASLRTQPNTRRSARWFAGLAVAATLLLALVPNWLRPSTPSVHAGEFSQQLTVVPGEVLRLLTTATETSQTQVTQLSPLANLTLPTWPAWKEVSLQVESPVRREISTWQESWQDLKSKIPGYESEI